MTFRNASTRSDEDTLRPPAVTAAPEDFKAAFRGHPAGVSVITADDGEGPAGLTATSLASVSADPALLVFSLDSASSAASVIVNSETVVVHLIGADHLELAKRFATRGIDRFADTSSWGRLETGEPVLLGVDRWLRGGIVERMVAGNSVVVLVNVVEVRNVESGRPPLVYQNRTWYSLGGAAALS